LPKRFLGDVLTGNLINIGNICCFGELAPEAWPKASKIYSHPELIRSVYESLRDCLGSKLSEARIRWRYPSFTRSISEKGEKSIL
jgi:hypothetical protein